MKHPFNPDFELKHHLLKDDGTFPNNDRLPLLIYKKAFLFNGNGDPLAMEQRFQTYQWVNGWRNGLYPFHHYHSTAHEVLGVYAGSVRAQFGGETGPVILAEAGDVIVVPAGVAHKNLNSSQDFRVAGAYPGGQSWDMNYGKPGERPGTDRKIAAVPLPSTDPLTGSKGGLIELWHV